MAYMMLGRVMTIFAYRQPLGPLPFILTILLLTVVLGVSISWSAVRASNINPAASVRYE